MDIPIYQVDAFAGELFKGNPAAVCPLEDYLPESTLQSIAQENNLSETAFFLKEGDGYGLRWFTPGLIIARAAPLHPRCAQPGGWPAPRW